MLALAGVPRTLALLLLLSAPWQAHAAAAPYTEWAFDMKRAVDGNDLDAVGALARKQPDFGRVWFYGLVFDLVTTGVPDADKAALRPRLLRVAEALQSVEPPDPWPLLLLDREASGGLDPLAKRARDKQQQLIDVLRGGDEMAARLGPVEDLEAADPVFYSLFFRAELAGTRLGGEREKDLLLRVARRMAEGYALGPGDIGPWRTLAAYLGGKEAPLTGEQQVEAHLGQGLNLRLAGDLPGARTRIHDAFQTAVGSRGASLYVVLLQNGVANASYWLGDFREARTVRMRVLQAVRPLAREPLTALVLEQMVAAHLGDSMLSELIAYTRELRALPATLGQGRMLRTLDRAQTAFAQAATAEATAGRLDAAMRYRTEAEAILGVLRTAEAVATVTVAGERENVRLARERALADSRAATGAVERRRGRFEASRAAYEEARAIYGPGLGDASTATRVLLDVAEVRLLEGGLDEALAAAEEARPGLTDAVDQARVSAVKGWARLRRGEIAPAFAHGNRGLEHLKSASNPPETTALRGALHRLAAAALDAAGLRDDAVRRLEIAATLDPSLATARMLAQARVEAGKAAEGAEALAGFTGDDDTARIAAVSRGCALLAAGRPDEALTALNRAPAMTLPHLRHDQIVGLTCLAAAHLARGDVARARPVLASAKALVLQYDDPALAWRLLALEGDAAAREGRWPEAAGAWRQAIARWGDALGGTPARGQTLEVRNLAHPLDISAVGRAAPDAFVRAAERDKKASEANLQAALSIATWDRRRAAAPFFTGLAHVGRAPASELGLSAATARAEGLRAVLADAVIEGPDRVAAGKAFVEAFAERARLLREQRVQSPAWEGWRTPAPSPAAALAPREGEIRVYSVVGEGGGHVFVWAAGDQSPLHFPLPGRPAVGNLAAKALAAVAGAPAAWTVTKGRAPTDPNEADWDALADPVPTLLPFTREKKLLARLSAPPFQRLIVHADGPLVRLPFAALVLEQPDRRKLGTPPMFVGAKWAVETRLLADAPAGTRTGEPAKRYALIGPLPDGADCPGTACADVQSEAGAVVAAFGASAPVFTALSGDQATREGLAQALNAHGHVHVVTPVDAATGDIWLAGGVPLTAAELAALPSAAEAFLVTRLAAGPVEAETGAGLRRLAAAAWHGGAGTLLLRVAHDGTPADAEAVSALALQVGSGATLETAVRTIQRDAMAQTVDPKVGGAARYHPYFWARWVLAPR